MSIPVTTNFTTGQMTAMLLLYADLGPSQPPGAWNSFGDFYQWLISQNVMPVVFNAHPPAGVIAARAASKTALDSIANALTPGLDGAVGFGVSGTGTTIAHGASGSVTITVTFVTGYSGTVLWSIADPFLTGITAVFSPTTSSASGTTSMTLTVPSGLAPGSYSVYAVGTDASSISNSIGFTVIVT